MDGTFACPECGSEIRLKGLSPGREVRCGWCQTWVVAPFLPRADQIKRMRRDRGRGRRKLLPAWAWAAVAALSVAITVAAASRAVRSRWRSADAEAMARLAATSRAAEAGGRLDDALAAIEGALSLAGRIHPTPPDLDDLRRQRERVARREAEARLSALDAAAADAEPGRAVGHALTLLERARKDPALAGLEAKIRDTLVRLRLQRIVADATAAGAAEKENRPGPTLELWERIARTADELPPEPRKHWRDEADAAARRIIEQSGAVIEPARGQFSLGSPYTYAASLKPLLTDTLRKAGYVPRPAEPFWHEFWSTLAPYHVRADVVERQDDVYLQSPNRLSQIQVTLSLSRREDRLWFETSNSRTQIPVPGLPAYVASRLAVSPRRSPEFERMLYENARNILYERLSSNLHKLPACPPTAPEPGPSHLVPSTASAHEHGSEGS